jgi:hypothetical protein
MVNKEEKALSRDVIEAFTIACRAPTIELHLFALRNPQLIFITTAEDVFNECQSYQD